MSSNIFLTLQSGIKRCIQAISTSAGAGDANKIIMTGGDGKLDSTLMPTGIGADTRSVVSSENLAAGDFVNEYDNASVPTVRKADPANGRPATGYVLAAVTSPANATVYPLGGTTNTAKSALTIGSLYVLDPATAGTAVTAASVTLANGNLRQVVGRAISSTDLQTIHEEPIEWQAS